MAYRVHIESFEGPFDLLLYLVSRQKVDIGSISINEITDQYLDEVARMQLVDLDVASDFLLVASTLLEIKAASLIPADKEAMVEEYEELAPSEARDLLVQRLLTYKQFKNAAASLSRRGEAEGRLHPRTCGPDLSLLTLMPDYLEGITLEDISYVCAQALARRDPFLLDSDHIAAKPIPVEVHVRGILNRIKDSKALKFSDLVDSSAQPAVIVVTFLAVLELYKRGMVKAQQDEPFGDIELSYIEGSPELFIDSNEVFDSDIPDAELSAQDYATGDIDVAVDAEVDVDVDADTKADTNAATEVPSYEQEDSSATAYSAAPAHEQEDNTEV